MADRRCLIDGSGIDPPLDHGAGAQRTGRGRGLVIFSRAAVGPERTLRVEVFDDRPFVVMSAGLHNTTGEALRLKSIEPLAGGLLFPGHGKRDGFRVIDGFSGGEPLEWGVKACTPVHRSHAVESRNNLAVTFGRGRERRSLVLGGLTYSEFEKFAGIRQSRRVELATGPDGRDSLAVCIDFDRATTDGDSPWLQMVEGRLEAQPHIGRLWCPEFSTYAVGDERVVVEATGLDPEGSYSLGFSWWNMEKHGPGTPRVQAIGVDQGVGTPRHVLLGERNAKAERRTKAVLVSS